MKLPYTLYNTLESFEVNYKADYEKYLNVVIGSNEVEFVNLLKEKYKEKKEFFEQLETIEIVFKYKFAKDKGNLDTDLLGNSSSYYDGLGSLFDSIEVAKQLLRLSNFRIYNYSDMEYLLNNFYYENDEQLVFNEVSYLRGKQEINNIITHLKNYQVKKESKIAQLDFNLNQTDLVHFFDLLVDADLMKEPENKVHRNKGGFYGKLAQYFTANGKQINPQSAKTIKTNKANKSTSYSESYYDMLRNLQKTIQQKLDPKSLL